MKYFNFLLENDITFKQDETGNYTALVKVFNPEYKQKRDRDILNEKNNFHPNSNKTKYDKRFFRSESSTEKRTQSLIKIPMMNRNHEKKVT